LEKLSAIMSERHDIGKCQKLIKPKGGHFKNHEKLSIKVFKRKILGKI